MSKSLIGLMQRTWTSNLVDESVKQRRMVIFEVAMGQKPECLPISNDIVDLALWRDQDGFFRSVELGLLLNGATYNDPFVADCSKWAISKIIARSKDRDDRWFKLVTKQLGVSKSEVENYLAHGDSIFLANLLHITRDILRFRSEDGYHNRAANETLSSVSKFDIQNALPGLQHDFCDLRNQIVREARNSEAQTWMLTHIFMIYPRILCATPK
ncbi:hypothetical protein B0F90DRAFT_1919924, partial [Multifurca ochricompacta]